MNEALLFLKWLQDTDSVQELIAQGPGWSEWVSSQGFSPTEILDALREISPSTDQSIVFHEKLIGHKWDESAFSHWAESLSVVPGSAETDALESVAGGTAAKAAPHSPLQRSLNHLAAKDAFVQKETADFIYKEIPSDHITNVSDQFYGGNKYHYQITTKNFNVIIGYGTYSPYVDLFNKKDGSESTFIAQRNSESKRFQGNSWVISSSTDYDSYYVKAYTDKYASIEYHHFAKYHSETLNAIKTSSFVNETISNLNADFNDTFKKASEDLRGFISGADSLLIECKEVAGRYPELSSLSNFLAYKRLSVAATLVSKHIASFKTKSLPALTTRLKAELLIDSLLVRQLLRTKIGRALSSTYQKRITEERIAKRQAKISLFKLSHPKIISKLKETQQNLINELREPKEYFLDHTTHYDTYNGNTYYYYTGNKISGQIEFSSTPYARVGIGDYTTANEDYWHNLQIERLNNGAYEYIIIGNKTYSPKSYVNNTDRSLLRLATSAEHSVKQVWYEWSTELNAYSRQALLNSHAVKKFRRHHKKISADYEQDFKTAKQIFKEIKDLGFKNLLSVRRKNEIFLLDLEARRALHNPLSKASKDERRAQDIDRQVTSSLNEAISLQNEYKYYKADYTEYKDTASKYIEIFGRIRPSSEATSYHLVHYDKYSNQKEWSQDHAEHGNYDYAENYAKTRVNLAAKREELFGHSEFTAIRAASSTYQQARQEGIPKQECIDMATATYLQTIIGEDVNFLKRKKEIIQDEETKLEDKYDDMNRRQRRFFYQDLSSSGLLDFRRDRAEERRSSDVLLSVGADILERQVNVAKKVYRDDQRHYTVLRLRLLVKRLTLEFTMAERYDKWYANHPKEYYHPVDKWFKHLGADIWDTLTLPERVIKSEIKGWESGAGFWGGIKDGWDTEGRILHQDIRGINHFVKSIENIFLDCFNWIPYVGKALDDVVGAVNLVCRGLENMPFTLAKNVTHLGKQLYKLVTLQVTWKGIWDGLGRDTKGIRHLVRHVDWLAHDILTGDFKNIGYVISRDFKDAKHGAKIYLDREEIKRAIVIKHDELLARRVLHRHFRHLVKSPMHIIAEDTYSNLKKDNTFANFRQSLLDSRYGDAYLKLASLYGTSFYKELKPGIKKDAWIFLDTAHDDVARGTSRLTSIITKQIEGLTVKQDVALKTDLDHHELWPVVFAYEKSELVEYAPIYTRLSSSIRFTINRFRKYRRFFKHSLVAFQHYLKNQQTSLQKKAQYWALHGGLLTWSQGVDKNFITTTKQLTKFLKSSQGQVFTAKAIRDYSIYRDKKLFEKQFESRIISPLDSLLGQTKTTYDRVLKRYQQYKREQGYISRQWNEWGKFDGKIALTAYDNTFRPQFTIDTATTPPTVTCSTLSHSEEKIVNANIKNKKIGKRFFERLLWTQYLNDTLDPKELESLQHRVSQDETFIHNNTAHLVKSYKRLVDYKRALISGLPSFLSSHTILVKFIEYDSSSKAIRLKNKAVDDAHKIQAISSRAKQIRALAPEIRLRVHKTLSNIPKEVRRETDFIKLMHVQISVFNKKNFDWFESLSSSSNIYVNHAEILSQHPEITSKHKLLCFQAALAYDFDRQPSGKNSTSPSRYHGLKSYAKKHNLTLTSDYESDKAEEEQGDDLTIGQVLVSVEVPPSTLKQQVKRILTNTEKEVPSNSSVDKGPVSGSGSESSHTSKFWFKLPQGSGSTTQPKKTSANVLLIWRQYKLIKHLTKKTEKAEAKSEDISFDSLASGEYEAAERKIIRKTNRQALRLDDDALDKATRSINREAIRLDDDIEFFDEEVSSAEELAESAVKDVAETLEKDAVHHVEHDLIDKGEDVEPGPDTLNPIDELDDFANTIIESTAQEVSGAAESDAAAAEDDVSKQVSADVEEGEFAVDEAAEIAAL